MHRFPIAPLLLLCCAVTVRAEDPLPEPPPPAKQYQAPTAEETEAAIPEPEVVITTRGEDRYEEYRVGGVLYMIKVIPKVGKPYYLIDREGHGEFDRSDLVPSVRPPMWVIKRF
jgi:hypothetical protein